jgi:thioredoxin 1
MKHVLAALAALAVAVAAFAAPLPYDPSADAHAALVRGGAQAKSEGKNLLIVFGANWCEDCRDLDKAMRGSSASLIASRFVVVKVDVGNFNHNLDLAQRYGNPIASGIPAAVVLTPNERVLYATRGGELADARRMGERGIFNFFSRVLSQYQPP